MYFINNTLRSAAVTLAAVLFVGASAHASTINFLTELEEVDGTLDYGTVITDQYASDGVIFSLLANTTDGPITDGFLAPETSGLFNTFNLGSAIIADFRQSVDMINTISFSSIIDTPLTAIAYGAGDVILGSASISGAEIGSITTTSTILWLELLNDSGTGYAGNDNLTTISMLSFGVTAVPIPAAAWLLISGLLSIFGFAKGRRRITAPNAQIA